MKKLRVGIFLDGFVYPPKEGINVHILELSRFLTTDLKFKVILIFCNRGWAKVNELEKESFDSLLLSERKFYDKKFISSIIAKLHLDLLQSHSPSYIVQLLGPLSIEKRLPLLLELHDLEKDIAITLDEPQEEIDYQNRLQEESAKYANVIRIMSRYDWIKFKKEYGKFSKHCVNIPICKNDVEIPFFKPNIKDKNVVFIGNLSYEPNLNAARHIIDEISVQCREINFFIVGRNFSNLKSEKNSNVVFTGPIEDLIPIISKMSIAIAPITEGSGMKLKLLSYLSSGLPVISTRIGSQGYWRTNTIIIEDNIKNFPRMIKENLADKDKLLRMGKDARQYFEHYYSFRKNQIRLTNLYYDCLKVMAKKKLHSFSTFRVKKLKWMSEKRDISKEKIFDYKYVTGKGKP